MGYLGSRKEEKWKGDLILICKVEGEIIYWDKLELETGEGQDKFETAIGGELGSLLRVLERDESKAQ